MSEERVARVATAIFNEIFPRTTGRAIPATMVGEYVDLAKAAIAAHEAALAAAGFVIVPRRPTEAMIEAGADAHEGSDYMGVEDFPRQAREIWSAMINAPLVSA